MAWYLNPSFLVYESPKKIKNLNGSLCVISKSLSQKSHMAVAAHILIWRFLSHIKLSIAALSHGKWQPTSFYLRESSLKSLPRSPKNPPTFLTCISPPKLNFNPCLPITIYGRHKSQRILQNRVCKSHLNGKSLNASPPSKDSSFLIQ